MESLRLEESEVAQEITLKIINPMLSHGANAQIAEFRITELKAAMRYWWRAINDVSINLKCCESVYFGGDTGNDNSIGSPIVIAKKTEKIKNGTIKFNNCNIDAIEKNSEITLVIHLKKWSKIDWSYYENLINIVSLIGSLGQRSRKGYGNFKIKTNAYFSNREQVRSVILEKINRLINETQEISERVSSFEERGEFIERRVKEFKYPTLKKIFVGELMSMDDYFKRIAVISKENKDLQKNIFAGFSEESKRYATPIYITCVGSEEKGRIFPVLAELSVPTEIEQSKEYEKYIEKFYTQFVF